MQHTRMTGISIVGFLVLLGVLCVLALPAAKLIPPYIEHYNVRQALTALQSDRKLTSNPGASETEFRGALQRRLDVNDVTSVTAEKLSVKNKREGFELKLKYDVTVPLISTVDVLLKFDEQVLVKRSEN